MVYDEFVSPEQEIINAMFEGVKDPTDIDRTLADVDNLTKRWAFE